MKRISIYCLLILCVSLAASAQRTKQLTILHTSDTHSRIEPIDSHAADQYAGMGGVVRRATFLKDYRAKHPDVLLFDCGDISQGTPYYNLFQGEVEVKMISVWTTWHVCFVWPIFRWCVPIMMLPGLSLRVW